MIGEDGLPTQINAKKYWGNCTVYVSKTGTKYHRKSCKYAYAPINIYTIKDEEPCKICTPPALPNKDWYIEYKKIEEIKKKYGIN